jgi:hypothetical protein
MGARPAARPVAGVEAGPPCTGHRRGCGDGDGRHRQARRQGVAGFGAHLRGPAGGAS